MRELIKLKSSGMDHRKADDEPEHLRIKYSILLENLLDIIYILDPEGHFRFVEGNVGSLLGFTPAELTGKHFTSIICPEDVRKAQWRFNERRTGNRSTKRFGLRLAINGGKSRHFDTQYLPVEINCFGVYDKPVSAKDKKFLGTYGVAKDITRQKQSEENLRESEEKFRLIFENAKDAIFWADTETGLITNCNKGAEALLEKAKEEIIGQHHNTLHPPHESEYYTERFKRNLSIEDGVDNEGEVITKSGKIIPVHITATVTSIGSTKIAQAICRDITERKRHERALEETKDYLDNIIESSLDSIVVSDRKGYITRVNKSFQELVGYEENELKGKPIQEFTITKEGTYESTTGELVKISKEFINDAQTMIKKLFEEGSISNWESYYVRKDKRIIPVEQNIFFLHDDKQNIIGSVGTIRDITGRKLTEKTIRESKDYLENIFKTTVDGIMVTDDKGFIVKVNKAIEQILGYREDEMKGRHTAELLTQDEEHRKRNFAMLEQLFEKGSVKNFKAEWCRKDGSLCPVEINITLLKDSEGKISGAVGAIRDITDREKAEKDLREARDFLESVIEASTDGILISDSMGNILSANSAMERMSEFSKEEMIGKHASVLTVEDKEMRKNILERTEELYEKGFATYESIYKSRDGKYIEIECISSMIKDGKGNYIAGVSILRDISERKRMEQQLFQSEKMKSLGELAGGVAHDFNNVLSAILGRAQLLEASIERSNGGHEKTKSAVDLKRGLEVIEKAAMDGAETVHRIQEFSRKRDDEKQFTKVDMNKIIEDAAEFTSVRWKNEAESRGIKIAVKKEFEARSYISGSASELREVFVNLINNAIDAMPEGGEIMIRTFTEDGNVVTEFEDTGMGIPNALRDRIFDPFFTTKGPQSTGLGMSVSYGIINRHGGIISVDSVKGKGTTFTISLPVSNGKECRKKVKTSTKGVKKANILVIEDEDDVRLVLSDILAEGGHKVEVAGSGSHGLEMFKKNAFDMVFTDLGMPGMTGWQVAEEIKKLNRQTPVALITGWEVKLKESQLKQGGIDLVLNKPFKIDQVQSLVQESIGIKEKLN